MQLDKFYTKNEVALNCISFIKEKIDLKTFDVILEPSAGNGSFSNLLFNEFNNILAFDIEPEEARIIKKNFFEFEPKSNTRYLVIGNPPFGRVSSLAVKFFNKASTFADVIAFIIPRTFKRVSIKNRLNRHFHLIYEFDIPERSFYPEMQAKCCFQIWGKKDVEREKIELDSTTNDFFILNLKNRDEANFAIRAYGSNCGEISFDIKNIAPRSWHFIKTDKVDFVIEKIKRMDFSISKDTARQDSIGAKEFIYLYKLIS